MARSTRPARRDLRRRRDQLLAVLRGRRGHRALPVRRRRRRGARIPLPECTGFILARLRARRGSRGSATASGCTARGSPTRGCAATRPSCCSTPTPRRSRARSAGTHDVFDYPVGTTSTAPWTRPTTRRPMPRSVVVEPVLRLGRRPAATDPLARDGRLRDARARASPCATRRCPRSSAAPTSAWRTRAVIEHLQSARRHRGRAAARAPVRPRPPPRRARAAQLLGLQLHRLPRAAQRLRQLAASAASRCSEFKQMVKHAARGGHRGHPRRRLQPHGRGQRRRARRCRFKGIDNAGLLPPRRPTTRAATSTTPARATRLNMRHPHVLQLIMDSLRYWVNEMHVDGFRFDLAADAGPRAARRRPALVVLRPHPAGPGGQRRSSSSPSRGTSARAATRSGNFPPLWSEWNGKYRDTVRDFWRGADGTRRRVRLPPHRQLATCTSATAGDPSPASTSSPPTTASRCATSSATTQKHNEANGEDNRDGTDDNRSWNCGVEGPTDDPAIVAAAPAPAAQLPGHAAAVPGRAHAARRRRARPHAARQQQRLLPGQRDCPGTTGSTPTATCSTSPAGSPTSASATPCSGGVAGCRDGP